MKRKKNTRAAKLAPVLQSILIVAITYILLTALLLIGTAPEQHDIQVGAPAAIDILATKDVNDVVTTEEHREAAAAAVEPSYKSVDSTVVGSVVGDIEAGFTQLLSLRDGTSASDALTLSDEQMEAVNNGLAVKVSREEYAALLGASSDDLRGLFSDTIAAVRDALNSTLPEGQEAGAVSRISRGLAVKGYDESLVSLATDVVRTFIRPNMLIDEETTELHRQQARDAVEMETCVKGEVIVRRGEIVTKAQYAMMSSLGLLKEDSLDIQLIAGIALVLLLILGCLGLYLWRCERDKLNAKSLMVLSLVMLIVTSVSLLISQWNPYMMPISLGAMLVYLLAGRRMALMFNVCLGVIVSLLTDASSGLFSVTMFAVVLMGLVSGPIIIAVYSMRMQRTTTLLAGVLVGISNFLCTMAVGLINSAELSDVFINALWAMSGGIISAILCIGIQPLMELIFNLATNSKLIELSNPNQPLLRRLLLEAPGTYHHSIIVANLAEAAASAVGGNGLLARVGAYYHDVGKLKRPIYFKENQLGDNPHDRTDPRVSAAIVTAHPRDGAALAQKARIPEPVVDIIRQHHGDSVPLWFYDKAVKLYGAENVDINAFRYDGPRPRTKEAACVMLADTIEAAARSIPDPTPEKIDTLIRKLVHNTLNGGQLDESPLTFNDLERICSAFSTVLTGVFHERIEYPDVALPPRTEHEEKPQSPAIPAANSETPHAEAKPAAETKPAPAAEAVHAEPKPVTTAEAAHAEAKPVAEAVHAEPKPAAESNHAEPKPAAESRPGASVNPAGTAAAAAAQTEEEAEADAH